MKRQGNPLQDKETWHLQVKHCGVLLLYSYMFVQLLACSRHAVVDRKDLCFEFILKTLRIISVFFFNLFLEDEQDVHYCGRCKLSFFTLSEYVQHKVNKVCRENKNTLREVVEKLPIGVNYKTSGTWEDPCSKDMDGFLTDDKNTTKINMLVTPDVSSTSRRVEVQFLEPLVGSELTKDLNIADEATSSECHTALIRIIIIMYHEHVCTHFISPSLFFLAFAVIVS